MFYFNFRGLFCKSLISEIDILNKDYYYFIKYWTFAFFWHSFVQISNHPLFFGSQNSGIPNVSVGTLKKSLFIYATVLVANLPAACFITSAAYMTSVLNDKAS